jgi:DNA topoisomerase-2
MSKSTTKKKDDTPTIEEQFKKKSLHQHILDLPDTYIGSVQCDTLNLYSYNDDENLITRNDKSIVLGLYKIFDEILVNAADNTVRDKKCNIIKVSINEKISEAISDFTSCSFKIECSSS